MSQAVKTSRNKSETKKPAEALFMSFCGLSVKRLPAVGIEPTLREKRDFESLYCF
jgi:hypothetical protein